MAVKKEINYMRNENLKKIGVSIEYTAEQILELKKCSEDYIYFVENYLATELALKMELLMLLLYFLDLHFEHLEY